MQIAPFVSKPTKWNCLSNVFIILIRLDRIVLIGNHRDAWVYGAGDPSSGTACLIDVLQTK